MEVFSKPDFKQKIHNISTFETSDNTTTLTIIFQVLIFHKSVIKYDRSDPTNELIIIIQKNIISKRIQCIFQCKFSHSNYVRSITNRTKILQSSQGELSTDMMTCHVHHNNNT